MKKGLIFDMDGTLWDSSVQVAKSWDIAIAECGYRRAALTREDMQRVMGKTMDVIAQILFPDTDGEFRAELLAHCCEVENAYLRMHGGVLYPKLRSTLEQLKGKYHLYIVSNCQKGYIEAFLDYYQMQKGDNIALLASRNALTEAVYVGDIQGDYDASQKAGVGFIHAAYGFGTINVPVPAIRSFDELPEAAARVLG